MRKPRNAFERVLSIIVDSVLTGITGLAVLVGGLLLISVILSLFFSNIRGPLPVPTETYAAFFDLVKEGDIAFREYRYDEAENLYDRAQSHLSVLIDFENESPSKDLRLLQHYHNSQTFLRTRIELVRISKEISRLER